jgi:hypothetical protein
MYTRYTWCDKDDRSHSVIKLVVQDLVQVFRGDLEFHSNYENILDPKHSGPRGWEVLSHPLPTRG